MCYKMTINLGNFLYLLSEICEGADQRLFRSILQNPDPVLHQRLPPVKPQSYNLRERPYDRVIPQCKSPVLRNSFIIRMLYKDSY